MLKEIFVYKNAELAKKKKRIIEKVCIILFSSKFIRSKNLLPNDPDCLCVATFLFLFMLSPKEGSGLGYNGSRDITKNY